MLVSSKAFPTSFEIGFQNHSLSNNLLNWTVQPLSRDVCRLCAAKVFPSFWPQSCQRRQGIYFYQYQLFASLSSRQFERGFLSNYTSIPITSYTRKRGGESWKKASFSNIVTFKLCSAVIRWLNEMLFVIQFSSAVHMHLLYIYGGGANFSFIKTSFYNASPLSLHTCIVALCAHAGIVYLWF